MARKTAAKVTAGWRQKVSEEMVMGIVRRQNRGDGTWKFRIEREEWQSHGYMERYEVNEALVKVCTPCPWVPDGMYRRL